MATTPAAPFVIHSNRRKRTVWDRFCYVKRAVKNWLRRHPRLSNRVNGCCWNIFVVPAWLIICIITGLELAWRWVQDLPSKCATKWSGRHPLSNEEIRERMRERRERYAVRQLPPTRPRRLTLGEKPEEMRDEFEAEQGTMNDEGASTQRDKKYEHSYAGLPTTGVEQRTVDQLGKSPLWRFPPEVREKIWEYTVGGHHIHIVRRRGRLGNVYCPLPDPTDPARRDICLDTRDKKGFYKPTAWPIDMRPLSLLLSCRQTYSEAISLLYTHNTFAFSDDTTLCTFLTSLLPHRRPLIAHMHLAPNFGKSEADMLACRPVLAPIYAPHVMPLNYWNLPANLKSLSVTPTRNRINPEPSGSRRYVEFIQNFIQSLNSVAVQGPFSLAWPEVERAEYWDPTPPTYTPGTHDARIDATSLQRRNLNLRKVPRLSGVDVVAFFMPVHVHCLHCTSYTIIRKTTRGFAEVCYYTRNAGGELVPPLYGTEPSRARYWTWHSFCGGWIELEYCYDRKVWKVTQGAEAITDEDAEEHLAACEEMYPREDGDLLGKLQGLERKNVLSTGGTTYGGRGGRGRAYEGVVLDEPVRETLLRNVGWALEGGEGVLAPKGSPAGSVYGGGEEAFV